MNRRDLLSASMLAGSAMLAPRAIWAAARQRSAKPDPFLAIICDLTIPATETPGALIAGVPAFVVLALEHGLRGGTPEDREQFERDLDVRSGSSYVVVPRVKQQTILEQVDGVALGRGTPPSPWSRIKSLIVIGYYTSEIGGSKELHYELVPGRWEPDVALKPGEREWSNDWVGVKYG
jgi:hypothetical protein